MEYREGIIKKYCPICLEDFVDHRADPNDKRLLDILRTESPEKICPKCIMNMRNGVIFITYSQIIGTEIVRTPGYFVLEEDGVRILLRDSPEDLQRALEKRVLLISDEQADNFQLWNYAVSPNKAKNKAKEYYKSLNQGLVPGLDEEE